MDRNDCNELFAAYSRPGLARTLRAFGLDVQYRAAAGDTLFLESPVGENHSVLDLVGGLGASLFGHHHPALVRAAQDCLTQRLPFNAQASIRSESARLAARLSALVGRSTGTEYVVTFGSTGADATEAAVKHATIERARRLAAVHDELAGSLRRARGDGADRMLLNTGSGEARSCAAVLESSLATVAQMRATEPVFVSLGGAFHGRTAAAGMLTDWVNVPEDLRVHGPRSVRVDSWESTDIVDALDRERTPIFTVSFDHAGIPQPRVRHVSSVAACFVEPIQGEGGIREVPVATLAAMRALADRHDAALVFDEIQCGMGRTGTFLASEPSGVKADYYLLSKSLGGGLAKISAMLVRSDRYVDDFGRHHTATFADDDHSAAVAAAALDLLADVQDRVAVTGTRLRDRLDAVAARWPDVIVDVRGRGLLLGIELAPPRPKSSLLREFLKPEAFGFLVSGAMLHRHGIRIMPTLSAPTTLRVQPSAYLSERDQDRFVDALEDTAELICNEDCASLLEHLTQPTRTDWRPPHHLRASSRPAVGSGLPGSAGPPRVAFLANLDTPATLRCLAPELARWSDAQCAAALDRMRGELAPFEVTRQLVSSASHDQVEVCLIAVPLTAAQAVQSLQAGHRRAVRDMVLEGVELAVRLGASVIGLGGYTSIVTDASRDVVEDAVRVTSGNSLTVACAYELLRGELVRLDAGQRRVGVVGAIGNMGAALTELLAPHSDSVVLVGRPGSASRLRRIADRLDTATVTVSEDMTALRDCRVVITATNSPVPVIGPECIADEPNVVVYDLAVPGDVHPAVTALPNATVISGGKMLLPSGQAPNFPGMNLPPGVLYSCIAEAVLLGFEPATPSPSYGGLTAGGVLAARALAARHNFVPYQAMSGAPPMPQYLPMFLGSNDFEVAAGGGKAAALHELVEAGFPVPPGFVIRPDFDLTAVSNDQLGAWVEHVGGFPVAVRSSGVLEDLDHASFAGQYESYLAVADLDTLRRRIADCRASAEGDRTQSYLARAGYSGDQARVAVLVQRQIDARTAGVGFTIDPIHGIEDYAVVECCDGLGERLVSGHVTPTRFRLRLRDGAVVDRIEGSDSVDCSESDVAALARLMVAVQARRRRPQDIEWAIDKDDTLWLLQSRAITAIGWRTDIDQFTDADFRDGGVSARVCTPMMYSLYRNAFQATMQQYFIDLKLQPPDEVPEWIAMYYGRPYWNVSAVKRCFSKVPGFDEQSFDADLGVSKSYGAAGPLRVPTTAATVFRALPVALAVKRSTAAQLAIVERFAADWPATYGSWREKVAALSRTSDSTFFADLAECLLTFHANTERTYFTTIYNNTVVQDDFKKAINKFDAASNGNTAVIDLMGGLADISHMAAQRSIVGLYRVARDEGLDGPMWDRALADFVAEQGFHADMELELTCPRWSEAPKRVRAMIESMLASGNTPTDPATGLAAQRKRFDDELAALRTRVRATPLTRLRFGTVLERHLARARTYLVARERMREFSSRCYAIVRAYLVEAGARLAADNRLADPDDVFMLPIDELVELSRDGLPPGAIGEEIRFRRAMYEGYRDLTPPHELGGGVSVAAPCVDGTRLTGLGCSPGTVTGTARVLLSLKEIGLLSPGDILVTRFTDPGWTPALGLVAGVVTEVGGMLSHAAVIGREYGIPAVLNVPAATSVLRSGQRICVDGSAGSVEILEDLTVARHRTDPPVPQQVSLVVESRLVTHKRMICVAGCDGSGKSTQIASLAAIFEQDGQSVAPVTIWDAFGDPVVSAKLPFGRPSDVYAYLRILTPLARAHFLFHAMHLALELATSRGPDVVLIDAYWYKYYATEVAHGGDPAMLRALAAGFPEPDRTFYLAVSPRAALARKARRSDYESGYGDERDFLDFQQRSREAIADLSSEFGWIELDGTAEADSITAAIVDRLAKDDR